MYLKKPLTIGIVVGIVLVITLIAGVSNGLDLWNILGLFLLMGILTLAVASVMLSRPIDRSMMGHRLIVPLVLLVIYLGIEGLLITRWIKWGRYEAYGVPAQAVIIDLDTRKYVVYYSFHVDTVSGNQGIFKGQAVVGAKTFQELTVGSRIDIRFLMADPNSSEIDVNLWNPWPFAACGLCFILLHLIWLGRVIITRR
jgi:hypothetical protein